jgi:lipid-A-disaccharide synthase
LSSCLLIAGEKSGEEHAMSFFPELIKLCPGVSFYGVGGESLKSHGMEILYNLGDFSSMGFSEVVSKIPFYLKAFKRIENEVLSRGTRTAILIDFQDFNMRLAAKLKLHGVKILYYVAPQAWAWKANRAVELSNNVHTLFTILPFEKEWFSTRGVKQIKAVTHPLVLTFKDEFSDIPEKPFGCWGDKLKLLLLPGSRRSEVYSLLPEFIRAVKVLKKVMNVEVHLVRVSHIDSDFYKLFSDEIDFFYNSEELTKVMKDCHFAIAASGTVTLSTGLFELPTVVCYKASILNEFIFSNFIKYRGPISLTNIIHNQKLFPEFIQSLVDPSLISYEIKTWTSNEKIYNELKAKLRDTKKLLNGEDFSVPAYMSQVINE